MVNKGLICAHKLLGYLLFPLRVSSAVSLTVLVVIAMALHNIGVLPKKIAYYIYKYLTFSITTIFGCNIHIKKDKEYEKYQAMSEDEKFVVVYNHINPIDIAILAPILDNYISFIAWDKLTNAFPISYICNFLEVIKIKKSNHSNTTQKINDFIENSKHKLCIAADQCAYFEK